MHFGEVAGAASRWSSRSGLDQGVKNEGLAFAWIKAPSPGPFNIAHQEGFRLRTIDVSDVDRALDAVLRNLTGSELASDFGFENLGRALNADIVSYVLEQPIILEQSPPKAVLFKDILKSTNAPVYLGAYLWAHAGFDSPMLMFVTVPAGIVVAGSAIGVSQALAAGLNKNR